MEEGDNETQLNPKGRYRRNPGAAEMTVNNIKTMCNILFIQIILIMTN